VRNAARTKDRVAGAKLVGLVADLKAEPSLQHLEPLILLEMQVQWRATGLEAPGIVGTERAGGIAAGNLAVEAAVEKVERSGVSVLARSDDER